MAKISKKGDKPAQEADDDGFEVVAPRRKSNRSKAKKPTPKSTGKNKKDVSKDGKNKKRKAQNAEMSVDDFARMATEKQTGWFESWKKPAWMPEITLTVQTLAEMTKEQAEYWTHSGCPADPMEVEWSASETFKNVNFCDIVLCYLTGMAVESKDIREVFKLTAQFISESAFISAVEQTFDENDIEAKFDCGVASGAILALCYAPAKLRRIVREVAQSLMKKEAKMPEDVSEFEAEVGAINRALKQRDRKLNDELKVLQDAVKLKLEEKESFEKETAEFRNFTKEYYGTRSGKLDANIKAKLVVKYNASSPLREKYSLEQFIALYGQTTALKRVQNKLYSFRGHKGFKEGCEWLERHTEEEEPSDDDEDEQMEKEDDVALDEDTLGLLGANDGS